MLISFVMPLNIWPSISASQLATRYPGVAFIHHISCMTTQYIGIILSNPISCHCLYLSDFIYDPVRQHHIEIQAFHDNILCVGLSKYVNVYNLHKNFHKFPLSTSIWAYQQAWFIITNNNILLWTQTCTYLKSSEYHFLNSMIPPLNSCAFSTTVFTIQPHVNYQTFLSNYIDIYFTI